MTPDAYLFLPGAQHIFSVAGMRGMTVHTAVAIALSEVVVRGLHLFQDVGMALLALADADPARGLVMADGTIFFLVRFMQIVADQKLSVAAVGTVTSQAFTQRSGIVGMLCLQFLLCMTLGAQVLLGYREQHWPIRIVRPVAGKALTIQVRFVRRCIFILQGGMAVQAARFDIIGDQTFCLCSMRGMANRALVEINGFVDNAFFE